MKVPKQAVFEISVMVHNLMINPKDLPKQNEVVLNERSIKVMLENDEWVEFNSYHGDWIKTKTPKLWYDIPYFKIEK